MVAGSDTGGFTEGQSVATPGSFTQIPSPKTWSNGDDLYPGTLNLEWRDTFNWLLRADTPAFYGSNADGASLTYTLNTAIPIKTEELKRGNIQHAANDSKVYVYEAGQYFILASLGATLTGTTGTTITSVIKINGVLQSAADTTRTSTTTPQSDTYMVTLPLASGDYVEIALGGNLTGTAPKGGTVECVPRLGVWWRSK